MKKSRMVMKFDAYGSLIINRGMQSIVFLIVFHLYCSSEHKLSMVLIANVENLFCHVNILTQNIVHVFFVCEFYL